MLNEASKTNSMRVSGLDCCAGKLKEHKAKVRRKRVLVLKLSDFFLKKCI
jgi:hypothetical protein